MDKSRPLSRQRGQRGHRSLSDCRPKARTLPKATRRPHQSLRGHRPHDETRQHNLPRSPDGQAVPPLRPAVTNRQHLRRAFCRNLPLPSRRRRHHLKSFSTFLSCVFRCACLVLRGLRNFFPSLTRTPKPRPGEATPPLGGTVSRPSVIIVAVPHPTLASQSIPH